MNTRFPLHVLLLAAAFSLNAHAGDTAAATGRNAHAGAALSQPPTVVVHKSPSCACCGRWSEAMQQAGFPIDVRNEANLLQIKEAVGVPVGMGSCHTAEVGGYFIEGHVPVEDVQRLLAEKPDAKGLVVPGMPMGATGMEMPGAHQQPYDVFLVAKDGTTTVYAHHGE